MNELIARLRKQSVCIYIAAEKTCADDVSDGLRTAADTIERMEKRIEELEREVASYKTLTMQLAKAEESACIEAFHADEDRKKAEASLRECMAHADAMAEWEWAHPHSEKFAAYRQWRAKP